MELSAIRFRLVLVGLALAFCILAMSIVIYQMAYSFGLSRIDSGAVQNPPQGPAIEYDNQAESLQPSRLPELPLYVPGSLN